MSPLPQVQVSSLWERNGVYGATDELEGSGAAGGGAPDDAPIALLELVYSGLHVVVDTASGHASDHRAGASVDRPPTRAATSPPCCARTLSYGLSRAQICSSGHTNAESVQSCPL